MLCNQSGFFLKNIGYEYHLFLYLEKEGDPLVVQAEGDTDIKVGDTIKVGFEASRCHLFDNNDQAFT